jgi:hypothetical protein
LQPARPQAFSRKFADAETYLKRATPFPSRVKHTAFNLQESPGREKTSIDSEMEQTRWRVLVERYAARAREYSDTVALLGQINQSPTECRELLEEIRVCHESCIVAAEEVTQYMEQMAATAHES